jgi:hypothetical protein
MHDDDVLVTGDRFLIYFASLSEFLPFRINPPYLSGQYQQIHLQESWREIAVNFADEIPLSYSAGFFNL